MEAGSSAHNICVGCCYSYGLLGSLFLTDGSERNMSTSLHPLMTRYYATGRWLHRLLLGWTQRWSHQDPIPLGTRLAVHPSIPTLGTFTQTVWETRLQKRRWREGCQHRLQNPCIPIRTTILPVAYQ